MNAKSSRSHAIFSVSLTQEKWIPSNVEKKRPSSSMSTRSSITPNTSRLFAASQEDGECLITTSKFHFVDLAGSERVNTKFYKKYIYCLQLFIFFIFFS